MHITHFVALIALCAYPTMGVVLHRFRLSPVEGVGMVACMADKIRLVLLVPEPTRTALRVQAAKQDMDMSDLARIVMETVFAKMEAGETPQFVADAIREFKQAATPTEVPSPNRAATKRPGKK